ncbi:MAG: glycosyltransferase family 2 protein [Candidatus Hydrogenedentota bacterium]
MLFPDGRGIIVVLLSLLLGILSLGFICYGLHRAVLLFVWHGGNILNPKVEIRGIAALDEIPCVTIQLPLYNELAVVERLLTAAASMDWPRDRFEIQVLDDSTDGTTGLAEQTAARLRETGVDIRCIRRADRANFKAGALANGLARARGEFIAIFDSDFLPPADFLRRTVLHFADPMTGMVQARWTFLNERDSFLTEAQALSLRAHFRIEHQARYRSGCFFNFNGTAGIWRAETIRDAGGWQGDTLTEDLDLSYRAQLRGWKFVYRDDIACDSELPPTMRSYKAQQFRWMKGMAQVARKLLPSLLLAPLPPRVKIEACAHLLAPLTYPMTLFSFLLLMPLLYAGGDFRALRSFYAMSLLATTCLVFVFHAASEWEERPGRGLADLLRRFAALLVVGAGNVVNATRAVTEGFLMRDSPFVRTPKRGDGLSASYTLKMDPFIVAEAAFLLYGAWLLRAAFALSWPMLPWTLLLFGGLALSIGGQLRESC